VGNGPLPVAGNVSSPVAFHPSTNVKVVGFRVTVVGHTNSSGLDFATVVGGGEDGGGEDVGGGEDGGGEDGGGITVALLSVAALTEVPAGESALQLANMTVPRAALISAAIRLTRTDRIMSQFREFDRFRTPSGA
jgi:hypothetical protein